MFQCCKYLKDGRRACTRSKGKLEHNFEYVFSEPVLRRPLLEGMDFKKLSERDMLLLE